MGLLAVVLLGVYTRNIFTQMCNDDIKDNPGAHYEVAVRRQFVAIAPVMYSLVLCIFAGVNWHVCAIHWYIGGNR